MKRYNLRRVRKHQLRLLLTGWLLIVGNLAWGQPTSVNGTLGAVGSDTMAGLVLRWGEALSARHPDINL
ncbi:MAG: phosphate ABC transporter substrate-binding protein, partial [Halomonas venusta]|nr:phosphate ABC transporter substrate-binding protein [Halomonas venusta]